MKEEISGEAGVELEVVRRKKRRRKRGVEETYDSS